MNWRDLNRSVFKASLFRQDNDPLGEKPVVLRPEMADQGKTLASADTYSDNGVRL
jgi:hypothetical protein